VGARGRILITWVSLPMNTSSKTSVNLPSRSPKINTRSVHSERAVRTQRSAKAFARRRHAGL
jgi:hypothetical protein